MFNVKDYSNKFIVLKASFVAWYGLPHLLQHTRWPLGHKVLKKISLKISLKRTQCFTLPNTNWKRIPKFWSIFGTANDNTFSLMLI